VSAGGGLTILAVDDEQAQLDDLARMLRTLPDVQDVECAFDGHDALVKASAHSYDAIFLDVRMPDLDGLELGRVLRRFASPPQLVFVSAYDNAAVDAFELHALDYLRKPVARQRLEEAVARVLAAVEAGPTGAAAGAGGGGVGVGGGVGGGENGHPGVESEMIAVANVRTGSTRLIARSSILFAQSYGDFVRIVSDDGRYLLRATLSELERRWEPFGFVRVHRQYVANLNRAVELRPRLGSTAELAFADGQTIPIARRQVADLSRRLGV
jgi:DNA-binding LytR/AlgR family response regulator